MTVIGYPAASPASTILQHLQRRGQATIKELEEALGVSTTAVREHLAHLQAEGLIVPSTVRRGPGRPHFVYKLTEKAQSLFPKHYDVLINLLLKEIAEAEGKEKLDHLLARVSRRLTSEYDGPISGADLRARLEELCARLEDRGVPAEVQPTGDGFQIFACPYFDVAQEHPDVCTMERQMIEGVIGEKISLESSIREGHHNCRFVIRET